MMMNEHGMVRQIEGDVIEFTCYLSIPIFRSCRVVDQRCCHFHRFMLVAFVPEIPIPLVVTCMLT